MPSPPDATRQQPQDDDDDDDDTPVRATTPSRRGVRRSRPASRVTSAGQQNVSPLRSPPPRRNSSTPQDPNNNNTDSNNNNNNRQRKKQNKRDKKRAEDWAKQLDVAIPILLDKLFSHLSTLPEEELCQRGGVTLPASALGWLTTQYFGPQEALRASTRDKLRLLRFLLPRITHLRITRQPLWPPPLDENAAVSQEPPTPSHNTPPEFFQTNQTTSGGSVCSALTTETSFPSRQAFLEFVQMLQERPMMDLGQLFPNLQVLVLDSVPPYWIVNFGSMAASLQVLRIEKACLYQLPEVFPLEEYSNLTYLRFSSCCVGELSKLPKLLRRLPNLQFLSLADNEIRLEKTALKGLRNLTNLKKLDLSGNRLSSLPYANMFLGNITCLNLAGNTLTDVNGIDKLYGLEVLDLSDNQIADLSDLRGLGKLPSLREFSVRGNPFLLKTPPGYETLRRPQAVEFEREYRLRILSWFASNRGGSMQELPLLHREPITEREMPYIRALMVHQKYIPSKATTTTATKIQKVQRKFKRKGKAKIQEFDDSMTIRPQKGEEKLKIAEQMTLQPIHVAFTLQDVLETLYQENRKAFPEDYEMEDEKEESPVPEQKEEKVPDAPEAPVSEQKEEEKKVLDEPEEEIPPEECSHQREEAADAQSVTSCDRHQTAKEDTVATSKMSDLSSTTERDPEQVQEGEGTLIHNVSNEEQEVEEKGKGKVVQVVSPAPSPVKSPKTSSARNPFDGDDDSELIESPSAVDTSTEQQLRLAVSQLSMSLMMDLAEEEEAQGDLETTDDTNNPGTTTKDDAENGEGILICDGAENENVLTENPVKSPERPSSAEPAPKETDKTPPRVATIKLSLGSPARGQLDIFGAGWDELVQLAAAGLIPDGKLKTPVENVTKAQPEEDIFAAADEELFGPVAPQKSKLDVDTSIAANSVATDDVSEVGSMIRSIAIDSTYQDDFSLPSFDASELQIQSKFQLAEDNCKYDGPDTCRNLNVIQNMDLYFTSFVFRDTTTTPASIESEIADGDPTPSTDQVHPRIQMWPEDRKSTRENEPSGLGELSQNNRERCIRVWEEDVIPCGKSSLRRLGPNRNVRLTFHGDKVVKNGSLRPYAESRKVYLCLSSEAFYVIARKDSVTLKKNRKKFPLPIKDKAKFEDAPWPHAIARHSYHDLQTIIIGFDFQRLTLRFSSRRRSDPYSYVLLTCNKRQTVSILQEIQNLKKELDEGVEELTSDNSAVAIENDSQVVFDALSEAVAPNMVGTIIRYQIVQQRWKRGNRGTVRRVCVVSDTKLFLLNEDYLSDGHTSLSNDGHRVGEVSYEVVDEATLDQVGEVRPADADPRSITILINPLSRLSRAHRWRLLCRDSDGAEKLVADVRRAIDMQ